MFVSGQSVFAGLVFSFMSFIVAVPSAIKVFNWTATMHKGWISFDAPMLYALGFIGLFTIGGLTGLFLACLAYDVYVTDTYFVVAHFHYIMVGGMVTAYFGGLHYWWPKITGRHVSGILGARGRDPDLLRLQHDVLPAVHPRLSRACRGAITSIRRSFRSGTCCRRPARRSSPSPICCRCSISAGRCSSARARPPIRGRRPGSNGRRRRRRRRTISTTTPEVTRDPYDYTLKGEARPQNA